MKPASFEYWSPTALEDALALLAEHGDEAQLLAGGQSLMPMLNMRLSRPTLIVDVNGIDELKAITVEGSTVKLGSMVRQRDAELDPRIRQRMPILSEALGFSGNVATRNRGTVGGSICHADPAAELPALAVFLDASLTLRSLRGTRAVSASEFHQGFFSTVLAPDEMLTEVSIPVLAHGVQTAVDEFTRRSHEFAIAGVFAALGRTQANIITSCRLLAFGVSGELTRLTHAEEILNGETYGSHVVEAAVAAAAASLAPLDDIVASSEYRLELVKTLCRRALNSAYTKGITENE